MKLWRFGQCTGCHRWRCPKVGPWYARRREHAYCPDCMPDLYQPSPATTFAVQFADLVELATQRDAFLAENDCHVVVHWIEAGQHQVELTFVRDVIPGADQPSHVALRGKGEHFWVALRDVLAQLRAHPDRQDVREALASPQ